MRRGQRSTRASERLSGPSRRCQHSPDNAMEPDALARPLPSSFTITMVAVSGLLKSPWALPVALLLVVLYVCVRAYLNWRILRQFKGPLPAKFTSFWMFWQTACSRLSNAEFDALQQHGKSSRMPDPGIGWRHSLKVLIILTWVCRLAMSNRATPAFNERRRPRAPHERSRITMEALGVVRRSPLRPSSGLSLLDARRKIPC